MSVIIKDMDMPADCLACRIACDKENYMVIGRPPKCPLAEAPVGDLISRADALRELNGVCSNWEDDAKVAEIINALPSADAVSREVYEKHIQADERIIDSYRREFADVASAEAVQGWIPCSEKLPSKDGRYLVTYPLFVRKDKWVNVLWYGKPLMPNIKVKGKCWYRSDDEYGDVVYDDSEIFAWMPLPKPFREDGEV